ncbi:hypothetical protein CHUAL_006171 [Chamberlinius hualienensis]
MEASKELLIASVAINRKQMKDLCHQVLSIFKEPVPTTKLGICEWEVYLERLKCRTTSWQDSKNGLFRFLTPEELQCESEIETLSVNAKIRLENKVNELAAASLPNSNSQS